MAGFAIAGAFGCQAILGIDGTTFVPDAGASDSGDGDDSSDGASGDATGGAFSLSPSTVRIPPGGSADVTVTIARAGGPSNVVITATDLDAGVSIAPLTIPSSATTGALHVSVSASTSPGAQDIATIQSSLGSTTPLTVIVPGLPGTVDETFANGEAIFGGTAAIAVAVAVQSTGKVVVGAQPTGASGWSIVRFDVDGNPDTTFNANAAETIPSGGQLSDLALGTHDDIFAAGSNGSQLTVYHVNADGTRDNTFGTLGVASLSNVNFSQGSNGVGIGVQSDGRPVVVGWQGPSGTPTPIVVRFDTNGAWDETFGGSGRTLLTTNQTLTDVVVLPDDRIAASGTDQATLPYDLIAAHFTKDGAADTSFSASGFVRSGANDEWTGNNIAIGPDGGYVVVGTNQSVSSLGCVVAQFPATGDAGVSGLMTGPGATKDSCTAAVTQSDGRFLVSGYGGANQQNWAYVERMLSATALDPSFNGGSGVVFFADHALNPSVAFRSIRDVAIAPDGRILAVGGQDSSGALVVRIWP